MPYTPFKVMVVELLEQIVKGLREMADQNETMKTETDRMANDVADMKTVVASAVAMITGLASQIHANADDPTAMHALADQLEASKNDLAAAVAANTPAAPADDGSAAGAGTTDTSGSGADAGAGAATGTATDSGAGSDAGAQATAAQATTTDSGAGADTSGADTTASTGSTDTGAADAGAGDGSDGSGGDGAAVEPPAAIDPTVDASVGDQVTDNQNGGA